MSGRQHQGDTVAVDASVVYADARAAAFEDMQGLITRSMIRTPDGPRLSERALRLACRRAAAVQRHIAERGGAA